MRALPPRVEKSRFSNKMHGERRDDERFARANDAQLRNANLSRFETIESAPLWHGPRLRAAFVAQILGQALENEVAPRSAKAGYEVRTQRLHNLLLDQKA